MVPKIHAKGSSFKGAAAYLLHDKERAETSERVGWTEVRNLAVNDPDKAWRIMAATAMDQDRLKEEAGVKNTGRKSDKHVLHISLAWHPDQEPGREEMMKAADGAMKAIGADGRQALYVAHSDEKHPHLHLLINRVSPEDGRLLSSSNDRLKLSKWAEAYEKECGQVLCENRVINNEARDKGEYVKGERDLARHIYEKQPANDNDLMRGVLAKERAKDHTEAEKDRALRAAQVKAWADLRADRQRQLTALSDKLASDVGKARRDVREDFRPEWLALNKHQEGERKTFDALEQSFFGRAGNIVRTVRVSSQDVSGEPRSNVISRSFRILTNAGDRRAFFDAAQERARKALEGRQAERLSSAVKELKASDQIARAAVRDDYLKRRESLVKEMEDTKAARQDAWKTRNQERDAAFTKAVELSRIQRQAQSDFDSSRMMRAAKHAKSATNEFKRAGDRTPEGKGRERGRERE